jgi:hypothetical protein
MKCFAPSVGQKYRDKASFCPESCGRLAVNMLETKLKIILIYCALANTGPKIILLRFKI